MPHRDLILAALTAHAPADAREAADVARTLAFVRSTPECFGERCPTGHLTGSAFVLDPAGRLLLTHHRKLDRWLQLGGHGEPHEHDLRLTALREAAEESGLVDLRLAPGAPVPFDVDVHRIPGRTDRPAHDHHDLRYLLCTDHPEDVALSAESHALRWVTLKEAAALGLRAEPALARALDKIAAWRATPG
jgi:8-oxo-dGTP pyrophosphatase MutT (NUDIX family)